MVRRAKAATQSKTEETGGRPRLRINVDDVRKLAALLCTYEEAASWFGITERTFIRRVKEPELADAWAVGKASGKLSLRRLHWRHAQMANSAGVQMTIHMSKHQLGETEKAALELSGHVDSTVEVSSARDRVNTKLDTLAKRIAGRVAGVAAAAGAKLHSGEPVR
jgi:hypothetical protein